MAADEPQFLTVGDGVAERRIAYLAQDASTPGRPGLVWLSGFRSEMTSTKATALAGYGREHGLAVTRFDYSGHGQSGGTFEEGTVSRWLDEADAVFSGATAGPQVLVGSSMGGYIALLLLLRDSARSAERRRVAGLVLIAPAWDMTERLMWARFPESVRREIETTGVYNRPSAYGDGPYAITRGLIEDGRRHLIADTPFNPGCPVRILHGLLDPDVPWEHGLDLEALLLGDWTRVTAVPDGEHRLSRPEDLELLFELVGEVVDLATPSRA
ncbi:MAG TPA: alpha/beta hydrolase [Hyphomicrobiaceae bacterium]|nr:alpha/beta hydrolase [Hyphomicrobiaceae bacterium]